MITPRVKPVHALALLLASTALALGCGDRHGVADGASAAPIEARVVTVSEASWSGRRSVTASVEPFRRAEPATILMGRVAQILRREGDRVREGELLARVEDRDVAARVAQAEAQLAAAQAAETNARFLRERMERLVARNAASARNLEDAVAAHDGALAGVAAAQEGIAAAKVAAGYARVVAPFAGVVSRRMVEVGDLAAPGRPLFVVEDLSKVKIEASVPESSLPELSPGMPVEVEIGDAGPVRSGTLAEVLPAADPGSRTFTARVVIDNADGALRSGMFARLRLGGEHAPAVAVPTSAIVRRGPLSGVFVADRDDVARLRWVSLGGKRDGLIEVLAGLDAGESVVIDPPAELEDGRRLLASSAEAR